MKFALSFAFILYLVSSLQAQERVDSLLRKKVVATNKLDQTTSRLDSITQLAVLPDTLIPGYQKLDSIRNGFNAEAAKIQSSYNESVGKIDAQINAVNRKLDSLENLKLPKTKLLSRLDSLNELKDKKLAEANSKIESLKSKTTGQLKKLDLPPQYNEPLQKLTSGVDNFGLKGDFVKLPEIEIPGYSLPKLDGVGNILKTGELGNLTSNLPKIETPVGDLGQVTDQLKNVQGDIKAIKDGNLNDVQGIPKAIEQQAGKIEGVQELQKQSGVIDQYKTQVEALNDPEKAKQLAIEKAKEVAIDHFAGKEQQLKSAMDQMAEYKQKYSSVSSIKDLPKRAPNAMKGKPFVERLLPGFYFQYQQKKYNLFDFNPYLSYHISGRFTAGVGWNQRFAWDRRLHDWNERARIFGPRTFVDFKLGKGFIAHIEPEVMNTFVPSTLLGNPDSGQREWVWGLMTGMKKQYTIYKNLRGTLLLQYNIFNPKYQAPYVDRLNSRIGFEYVLTKKNKS